MKKILIILPFLIMGCSNLKFYEYYGKYYEITGEFEMIKRMIIEDVASGAIHPLVAEDYLRQIDNINAKIINLSQYGKKPFGVK